MKLTEDDILPLVTRYRQKLRLTSLDFTRYLYERINWESRIIGIRGKRGVGKSTLILQRILKAHTDPEEAIYVSLDDMWFSVHSVEDMVEFFYSRGILYYYFDEVHKYANWTRNLKNLYDFYPDIKIVYTGSAMLSIDNSKADLSRRQTLYTLRGMSFREYLAFQGIANIGPFSLEELLRNHVAIAAELATKTKILRDFSDYLRFGYYPFFKESGADFQIRLAEIVRLVIEVDIPEGSEVSPATISKLKTLMMILSENAPLEPNISRLSEGLECSRELCLKMLYLLDQAALIQIMFSRPRTYKQMKGPEKVLGGDPNILNVLTSVSNSGTIRETFFADQLACLGEVVLSEKGDFKVGGKYIFEVGGPNKKFTQIADLPDSYLAIDNIESGYGARIPLYLFGFLY